LAKVPDDLIFFAIKLELSRRDKISYYFSSILWNPQKYRDFYINVLKKIDDASGRIPVISNLENFENNKLF